MSILPSYIRVTLTTILHMLLCSDNVFLSQFDVGIQSQSHRGEQPKEEHLCGGAMNHALLFGDFPHAYTLELPPTQDASHHQDYSILSRESQPKPFICDWNPGWGGRQNM